MVDDHHIPGVALPRTMLRIVGIACLAFGSLEALFVIVSIEQVVTRAPFDQQTPYGLHFFIFVVAIALIVQVGLLFCGGQLMRYRTNVRHILMVLAIAPIAMVVSLLVLRRIAPPHIALSAMRATGIGPTGMGLQLLTLFPLWAPAIVYWAHSRLKAVPDQRRAKGLCIHCGYDLKSSTPPCPECGLE